MAPEAKIGSPIDPKYIVEVLEPLIFIDIEVETSDVAAALIFKSIGSERIKLLNVNEKVLSDSKSNLSPNHLLPIWAILYSSIS